MEKKGRLKKLRGWFPQEPKLQRLSGNPNLKLKNSNVNYKVSGNRLLPKSIFLAIFLSVLALVQLSLFSPSNSLPLSLQLACIVAGIAVGLAFGIIIVLKELTALALKGKSSSFYSIVFVILFIAAIFAVLIMINGDPISRSRLATFEVGFQFFSYSSLVTWFDVSTICYLIWEIRYKSRILTDGLQLYTVPKLQQNPMIEGATI
jgi:hypothetical protein